MFPPKPQPMPLRQNCAEQVAIGWSRDLRGQSGVQRSGAGSVDHVRTWL